MDENLELIEQEKKRLLEELSKVEYGSDEAKRYLEDLKDLYAMANKDHELINEGKRIEAEATAKAAALQLEHEKSVQEAEDKAKERRNNWILVVVDGVVKIVVAGAGIMIASMNNGFMGKALGEVFKFESDGHYVGSMAGKGIIGGLFRRK